MQILCILGSLALGRVGKTGVLTALFSAWGRRRGWATARAGRLPRETAPYLFIQPMAVGNQVAMAGKNITISTAASWM